MSACAIIPELEFAEFTDSRCVRILRYPMRSTPSYAPQKPADPRMNTKKSCSDTLALYSWYSILTPATEKGNVALLGASMPLTRRNDTGDDVGSLRSTGTPVAVYEPSRRR